MWSNLTAMEGGRASKREGPPGFQQHPSEGQPLSVTNVKTEENLVYKPYVTIGGFLFFFFGGENNIITFKI